MTRDFGENAGRDFPTGETIHVFRPPGEKWRIRSCDWSWTEGKHYGPGGVILGPRQLMTATIFAETAGWQDVRFETQDDAYSFVRQQIFGRFRHAKCN